MSEDTKAPGGEGKAICWGRHEGSRKQTGAGKPPDPSGQRLLSTGLGVKPRTSLPAVYLPTDCPPTKSSQPSLQGRTVPFPAPPYHGRLWLPFQARSLAHACWRTGPAVGVDLPAEAPAAQGPCLWLCSHSSRPRRAGLCRLLCVLPPLNPFNLPLSPGRHQWPADPRSS